MHMKFLNSTVKVHLEFKLVVMIDIYLTCDAKYIVPLS